MQESDRNGQEVSEIVKTSESCTPSHKTAEIGAIAIIRIFGFWQKTCFLARTCQPQTLDG